MRRSFVLKNSAAFCLSLAEAHLTLSDHILGHMKKQIPNLYSAVYVTQLWWNTAQNILVPRNLKEIEDLPFFLIDVLRRDNGENRFVTLKEDDIVREFYEWVDGFTPQAHSNWIPYVELTGLFQTFMRFHNGVRWGASLERQGHSSSFYNRAYKLHPSHRVSCPEGWDRQKPFVHIHQWMLERGSTDQNSLFAKYGALQAFSPRSGELRALDVCSQSGYVTDLLLKVGASDILAIDAEASSSEDVERTVHEHMQERRSSNSRKNVHTMYSELLPQTGLIEPFKSTGNASVYHDAAARRRQMARSHEVDPPKSQEGIGSFDLLYYHPPAPLLEPCGIISGNFLHSSAWWRGLEKREKVPFMVFPLADTHAVTHPHTSLSTLQQFVDYLRKDVTHRVNKLPTNWNGPPLPRALLKDDGYCLFVLPRTFDLLPLLDNFSRDGYRADKASLSDWVLTQLDGYYDVVMRKRINCSSKSQKDAMMNSFGTYLRFLSSSQALPVTEYNKFYEEHMWTDVLVLHKNEKVSKVYLAENYKDHFVSEEVKNTIAALQSAHLSRKKAEKQKMQRPLEEEFNGVRWEDSFEYNEYKPKSNTQTRHHWTDEVPSYSYLEDTFYDDKEKLQQNFLAVGHLPLPKKSEVTAPVDESSKLSLPALNAAEESVINFRSLFAEELRTKRKAKIRKLALSPLNQQEWYIDEKLIRSEGAKIEFMNELSRWDLKDYD